MFTESRKDGLRVKLRDMLGVSRSTEAPARAPRGAVRGNGFKVEKWIYESEPGSWVTAVMYLPDKAECPLPALIITNGHGESKSTINHLYAGPLFARLGVICLFTDMIGEEERNIAGMTGTRAHDAPEADRRAAAAGRLMLGKVITDCARGLDFLKCDSRVDSTRLGVAGMSLGCATSQWLTALCPEVRVSLMASFGLTRYNEIGKPCTSAPFKALAKICEWSEFLSLFAPHSACFFMNGTADAIMDPSLSGEYIRALREGEAIFEIIRREEGERVKYKFVEAEGGGHRAYHMTKDALLWLSDSVGTPLMSRDEIANMSEVRFASWCERWGFGCPKSERLYWTEAHSLGAIYADSNAAPMRPEALRCLDDSEIGDPKYTLEGWLDIIEGRNAL